MFKPPTLFVVHKQFKPRFIVIVVYTHVRAQPSQNTSNDKTSRTMRHWIDFNSHLKTYDFCFKYIFNNFKTA